MSAIYDSYKYRPLEGSDIRLVHLYPSRTYKDDIYISIIHKPLDPAKDDPNSGRMTRKELQKTLPQGWEVFETPEGRFLFCFDPEDDEDDGSDDQKAASYDEDRDDGSSSEDGDFLTTWDHPDPKFDRALYELPPTENIWKREPVFEALSYTWGSQDDPGVVYIKPTSGQSDNVTTLPIGQNLESALRHLRSTGATDTRSDPRVLWIDAICINQNDDAEKAVQVVRMADIYSFTTRVVVWLGPASNDSDIAVSTIAHLGAQVETTLDGFRMTSPGAEEPEWYNIDVELPYTLRQWTAINCLIERLWFSRVWTAQEIQLANRLAMVQVGFAQVPWSLFRRAVDCLKDKSRHGEGERLALTSLTSSVMNAKGRPLVDLIRRNGHRQCSNAHDKIYGILAMVPPKFLAATHPDYKQPVSKTHRDAFIANTTLMERWDLFGCDVIDRTDDFKDAPSWIPDFTASRRHTYFSGLLQFTAGNSRLDFKFTDSDEFRVRGVRCAVVKEVGKYCTSLAAIRSWEPKDLYTGTYITGEPLFDAVAKTLVQNDLRERNPTDEGWPTLAEWKTYCQRRIFTKSNKPTRELDTSVYFDDMISGRSWGRVFMQTEEGYIGLGPRGCEAGDVICVIPGCNLPVVLRPQGNGNHRLVGECFVYGLDDAQALLGKMPHPWRVQVFDHLDYDFRIEHRYFNEETKKLTALDPRLEDDPEWQRVALEDLGRPLTGDDPLVLDFFRNKKTGEMMNSDPRMLPEALEARGVAMEWLTII